MSNVTPCCPPVLHSALGKRDAEDLAKTLKALADPVRLRVLSFIAAQPDAEACVCHVTAPVGLSQPTVSHHLKLLHAAGLLERDKRGAWVYYRVVRERLEAVRAALATRAPRANVAARASRVRAVKRA
jgi:ArsR family transcriptional regulator